MRKAWQSLGWLALLLAPTLVLVLAAPERAPAQGRTDLFTVSPVPVDVTAENTIAARDRAIAEGEQRAFAMLMERLVKADDRKRVPKVTTAQLNDLVQGFEVAHERRSGVRYAADYTVHFRGEAVRRLLRDAGVEFTDQTSKPVLVLPVYSSNGRAVLWEDPNPWRDAWANTSPGTGLVPVVRPLGQIEDLQAIDAAAAVKGDDDKLAAIARRYGDADVLVTVATPRTEGGAQGLDVATTRYTPGLAGAQQSWAVPITANPGESAEAVMARAIAETMTQVERAWRNAATLDTKQGGMLVARVPAKTLQDWIAVRDRLAAVAAVRASRLVSLDREGAQVELRYVGDPQQLRLALQQRDLELDGNDPDWILQRRSAQTPPAETPR